jgi:multiple sugar transport system substrate-binding protein
MQLKICRKFAPRPNFFSICAILTVLVGCGSPSQNATVPLSPHAGVKLRLALPEGPAAEVLARAARAWAVETGATVEVLRTSTGNGAVDADVWAIEPAELLHYVEAVKLRSVPAAYTPNAGDTALDWPDILPLYRNLLLSDGRQTFALPLMGEGAICCYRSDLLNDGQHQAAFQAAQGRPLAPPETWDDFANLAEFFSGRGVTALPPLPSSDEALDAEFYRVAAPLMVRSHAEGESQLPTRDELLSFQYDLATGKPRIASAGAVHALQLLQRLQKTRPTTSVDEPANAFLKGDAVLCVVNATWLARFEAPDSTIRGKVGFCRVPGSRTVYVGTEGTAVDLGTKVNFTSYLGSGGWLGVVPGRSKNPDAAFALLAELAGPTVSREVVSSPRWGGGPVRESHFMKAETWYAYGLDAQRTGALKNVLRAGLYPLPHNPTLRLRIPDQAEHSRVLTAAVRSALMKDTDAAEALRAVARRWEEMDVGRGTEGMRDVYRRSLGR